MKINDMGANDRKNWKGLNLLGDILTNLRESFKIENKPKSKLKPN